MINIAGNLWIPSEGFHHISNGDTFTKKILLGSTDNIENWYDTNEPPKAEEGFYYALNEDLEWEMVEAPPSEESPEQTPEERIAELEEALEMILSGVTE